LTVIDIGATIVVNNSNCRKNNQKYMAVVDINARYAAPESDNNDSKKNMVYLSDTGEFYTVSIAENIGEAMGFADFETSSVSGFLPRGMRMRTVSFKDASGKISGQYPCGTPSTPIFVEGGTITVARKGKAAGVVCTVLGAQGEKRTIASAADTGQNSGDIT